MSVGLENGQWVEEQQAAFQSRTGAALAFLPELKRALLDLAGHEPFHSQVKVNVAEEDPYLITVSAGLFELKFAFDVLSDTVFYAFTSASLKRVIPMDTAIFHYGQMNLTRGPWGVIDNPGEDIHKVFVDDPQGVKYFPLADQLARWSLEQLMGGYPAIEALEEAVSAAAEAKEKAAKKETKGDNASRE